MRRLVREGGPAVAVLGFAAAPWTLASYMVEGRTKEGFATIKSFMYAEPRAFRELLARIAQATISYLQAQIQAGAAAVQLFDTWCGELNLRDYLDFALPAVQEIVSGLGESVPGVYYTKASNHLLLAAAGSGADGLRGGWRVGFGGVRKKLGPENALRGKGGSGVVFGSSRNDPR